MYGTLFDHLDALRYLTARPSVYVISDKMYDEYKARVRESKVKDLEASISRLESRLKDLKDEKAALLAS